ncbi:MAG: FapA family protein [Lachnospiraceae bacterium]|nr:FapA family protein [Lachnospiraceae bacterium]
MNYDIDITAYAEAGYDTEQLEAISQALSGQIDIDPYLDKRYHGSCIREIAIGLKNGIDVSIYADTEYTWRQMREIRLGLEKRVDVKQYLSPYYSNWQMREIRLGLEAGLEVDSYKSLMYTAKVMHRKRLILENEALLSGNAVTWQTVELEQCILYISSDDMSVQLEIKEECGELDEQVLRHILENNGIVYGIDETGLLEAASSAGSTGRRINIASGVRAEKGRDGYYVWCFDNRIDVMPKQMQDGAADFESMKWFETVNAGKTLAVYYPAEDGLDGMSVKGERIPAEKGKELPRLTGKGFETSGDGYTYIACTDGHVRLRGYKMEVEKLLVIDGSDIAEKRLAFGGSIYIRGNVDNGYSISALGDIVVDGYVRCARLESRKNILVRKGMNAVSGKGSIKAAGNILGCYFDSAELKAGKNIYLTSSLNSKLFAGGGIITFGDRGGIVGGCAYAERGFCISNAGNNAGSHTILRLGLNPEIRELQEELDKRLLLVREEINELKTAYNEMCSKYILGSAEDADMFAMLENKIYARTVEAREITEQKMAVRQRARRAMQSQIIIDHTLYSNVAVSLNDDSFYPKQVSHAAVKHKNNRFYVEKIYA